MEAANFFQTQLLHHWRGHLVRIETSVPSNGASCEKLRVLRPEKLVVAFLSRVSLSLKSRTERRRLLWENQMCIDQKLTALWGKGMRHLLRSFTSSIPMPCAQLCPAAPVPRCFTPIGRLGVPAELVAFGVVVPAVIREDRVPNPARSQVSSGGCGRSGPSGRRLSRHR